MSHLRGTSVIFKIVYSPSNLVNLANLAQVLYYASAEERETICCFFNFQDNGLPLGVMKNQLIECLLLGKEAQSESQNVIKLNVNFPLIKIPWEGLCFIYFSVCNAVLQCDSLGANIN